MSTYTNTNNPLAPAWKLVQYAAIFSYGGNKIGFWFVVFFSLGDVGLAFAKSLLPPGEENPGASNNVCPADENTWVLSWRGRPTGATDNRVTKPEINPHHTNDERCWNGTLHPFIHYAKNRHAVSFVGCYSSPFNSLSVCMPAVRVFVLDSSF